MIGTRDTGSNKSMSLGEEILASLPKVPVIDIDPTDNPEPKKTTDGRCNF